DRETLTAIGLFNGRGKMGAITPLRFGLTAAIVTLGLISEANATSVRTFVASTGNDANTASNCPRTAPCRNFSAAIGVTSTGGEIVALDAAGYGTVTINKAVTIIGVDGTFVAVPSGGTGISITGLTGTDTVILRNIQVSGAGATNTVGISITAGRL